jgi:hypothetical protein
MNDKRVNGQEVFLFTHCVGCGREYKVKKGEKIDRLMFCSDECVNNTPLEDGGHISYDQDGIILNQ